MKKVFALILALSMIFLLAACGATAGNGGDGGDGGDGGNGGGSGADYKAAVELYADARYHGNASKIEEMAPAAFWTYNEEMNKSPKSYMIEGIQWTINSEYESRQYTYGTDYTISVEMEEKEPIPEADVALIKTALEQQKGIAADKIAEVKDLDLAVTLNGTVSYTEHESIAVVKIDGAWYCAQYYMYDSMCYILFAIEQMGEAG